MNRSVLLAAGVAVALGVSACRDLVAPGSDINPSRLRTIHGMVLGGDQLTASDLRVRFETNVYGDSTVNGGIWLGETVGTQEFLTRVPRGTAAPARIRLRYLVRTGEYGFVYFDEVDLGTDSLVVDVNPVTVNGRIEFPDGFDGIDFAQTSVRFDRSGSSDAWSAAVDSLGRFDLVMPGGRWDLAVDYTPSGFRPQVSVLRNGVVVGGELVIAEDLDSRWLQVEMPAGFPVRSLRLDSEEERFFASSVGTVFTPNAPAARAWFYPGSPYFDWSVSFEDDAGSVAVMEPPQDGDFFRGSDASDTLVVSLGDHVVTFDVRLDGAPVASARVQAIHRDGELEDRTDGDGMLVAALYEGTFELTVTSSGSETWREWVEVLGPRTIRVDLQPAGGAHEE